MHWAWFEHLTLVATWNSEHLLDSVKADCLPELFLSSSPISPKYNQLPVYLASVVPQQTIVWQSYQKLKLIDIQEIELTNLYSSIGIDRALAAWGAIATYRQSCLIIDGGTALTFTSVGRSGQFMGGAILPGLRSQLTTLSQKTAALPAIELPQTLPERWAFNTKEAIASGLVYTAIASTHSYTTDWLRQFPTGKIIFTGGDGEILSQYFHQQFPDLARFTIVDRNLVFWGIRLIYQRQRNI